MSNIHGHAKGGKTTPTYKSWVAMKRRCYSLRDKRYLHYGAKGITVCERWHLFENFLADMGERPEGKTLDRKENDKGYYLENCRWATSFEQNNNQSRNRKITYNGKTQNATEWANELKIRPHILFNRINSGWDLERALQTFDVPKN